MEPYNPDLYSEPHTIQLLERLGVSREAAREVFNRCPPISDGRDGKVVSLDAMHRILQEDRNTAALNVHLMAAALRVEDYAALECDYVEPDRTQEMER